MSRLLWSWKNERKLMLWLIVGFLFIVAIWALVIFPLWVSAGMLPHMAVINIFLFFWGLWQLVCVYFNVSEYNIMRYLK